MGYGKLEDLGRWVVPTLGAGPAFGSVFIFGTVTINERGQVAGASYTNSTPDPILGVPTTDPFLWEKGKGMHDLGSLGGTMGVVSFLNNQGQAGGQSYLAGNMEAHAFRWDSRNGIKDLGTPGGTYSIPHWMNDSGEIVGGATTASNQFFHAALWSNNGVTDLGTADGDGCSDALAVNSKVQIVGQSFSCDFSTARAFIWENGSMVDLNALIPRNSSLHLVSAANINDRGEIVGVGVPPGDPPNTDLFGRLFLLVPCGEGEEGCGDSTEGTAAETQGGSAPHSQPAEATQGRLTPEMLAALRARFARRYHFPGVEHH